MNLKIVQMKNFKIKKPWTIKFLLWLRGDAMKYEYIHM